MDAETEGRGNPSGPSMQTQRPVPNPNDFVLWSFFNAMFCNPFCLGFIALVFSVKARDKKIAQDPAGAKTFGKTAKHLNIAALSLGILSYILLIVLLVVIYVNALQYTRARDCKVQGDVEGAQRHGNRARVLNIIFTILIAVGVVCVISIIFIALLQSRV
ncbi:PREDICTED: interferon-induced transmembrane protein 3 [Chaetura pelagica]|uniref:interferon-induced transmembrane protein 3 n=1 Tax=Chaetura pelagica TaxID=8897 RepID=UPI000523C472|nr:PREDICTED: interferon-induced transmembrane protein 3 [Chaetura pelagica]